MTGFSGLRYTGWRAVPATPTITVRLTNGLRVVLRRPPAEDLLLFREIFVEEVYRSRKPDDSEVARIVDVGANVGYSILWFAARFPFAKIMAYEPVPEHVALLRDAVRINCLDGRVKLYPVAVGTESQDAYITTEGLRSQLVFEDGPTRLKTAVVDFFESVGTQTVDILKLDCEGSEYDLLMDSRFAKLSVRTLLLEWHASKNRPQADLEIVARLRELGWQINRTVEGHTPDPNNRIGVVHAIQPKAFGLSIESYSVREPQP
jgi:FkbM family methyltransferase